MQDVLRSTEFLRDNQEPDVSANRRTQLDLRLHVSWRQLGQECPFALHQLAGNNNSLGHIWLGKVVEDLCLPHAFVFEVFDTFFFDGAAVLGVAVPISTLVVVLAVEDLLALAAHQLGRLPAILAVVDHLFLLLDHAFLAHSNKPIQQSPNPSSPIKQQSFIVCMSVLFIGERNIGNYHSPYFSTGQEAVIARRERKAKQDQYRLDLLHQMREKQDRLWQERNSDIIFSRRYERLPPPSPLLTQHPDPYPRALSFQNKPVDSTVEASIQKIRQRQAGISFQTPSTPLRRSRVHSRLKTQNLYERSHDLESMVADLERKKEELELYDDRKIGEVYRKMHDSVRKMSTDPAESDSMPLKNNFRERYKTLFAQQQSANPEQEIPATYKLPSINRAINSRQEPRAQQNWQQWYAKEKMRELQGYYRRLTIDPNIPYQLPPSLLTPGASRRQYP